MVRKMFFFGFYFWFIAGFFLLIGCEEEPVVRTVEVEFELQLINASSYGWGYGIDGGQGFSGSGATNEVLRDSIYATVGQPVFIKAFGEQWSSREPGHEIIGRILVDGEEIYICADQGTPDEETEIECGGPVYIPDDDDQ